MLVKKKKRIFSKQGAYSNHHRPVSDRVSAKNHCFGSVSRQAKINRKNRRDFAFSVTTTVSSRSDNSTRFILQEKHKTWAYQEYSVNREGKSFFEHTV
jgi:hypothetical protein